MFIQNLETSINKIQVQNIDNADVSVINNSPLQMIGKGRQGAVFQLTDEICVKVFGNTEDCDREYYALTLGQHTNLFPKLYRKGPLYIAMEFIKGVDIREYLQSQPLNRMLSAKLIDMLITFKKIGYERIDHHKRQIYLQEDGSLKVIDVARTVWRDRVYPYPRKLLTSLGEENKALFLTHVQEMAPEVYEEWLHYIRMEEISRQITERLLAKNVEIETVKELSKTLLTTNDEKKYVVLLEGLVHKVFKEEWIKTMLAMGADPEMVMAKIDEHWNKLEQSVTNENRNAGRHFEGERRSHEEPRHEKRRFSGETSRDRDHHRRGEKSHERDKHHEGDRHPHRGKHYVGERSDNRDHKNRHQEKDKHRRRK